MVMVVMVPRGEEDRNHVRLPLEDSQPVWSCQPGHAPDPADRDELRAEIRPDPNSIVDYRPNQ